MTIRFWIKRALAFILAAIGSGLERAKAVTARRQSDVDAGAEQQAAATQEATDKITEEAKAANAELEKAPDADVDERLSRWLR